MIVKNNDIADPCVYTHQSDGWSAFVSEQTRHAVNGDTVVRTGRSRKEYLLERGVVKTIDAAGRIRARLLVKPARPLDEGCSCWHVLQASADFPHAQGLRTHGGRGECLRAGRIICGPFPPSHARQASLLVRTGDVAGR